MASLSSLLEQDPTLRSRLLPPKIEEVKKPTDWVKIGAIALLVIFGLVAACAGLSITGALPTAFFGGKQIAIYVAIGAGIVAAGSGIVVYYKWKHSD